MTESEIIKQKDIRIMELLEQVADSRKVIIQLMGEVGELKAQKTVYLPYDRTPVNIPSVWPVPYYTCANDSTITISGTEVKSEYIDSKELNRKIESQNAKRLISNYIEKGQDQLSTVPYWY